MMTQQLRASILSAPLAAIDRRALSQAWYSALHIARLAEERDAPKPLRPCTPPSASHPLAKARDASAAQRGGFPEAPRVPARSSERRTAAEALVDRRAPRSSLARQIEKIFFDPQGRVERSTFSLERGGARVHVVLQSKGDRIALIAICAPEQKDMVARALAQARYALASRGIAIDVEERGRSRCF
jgi:hypothetical protein